MSAIHVTNVVFTSQNLNLSFVPDLKFSVIDPRRSGRTTSPTFPELPENSESLFGVKGPFRILLNKIRQSLKNFPQRLSKVLTLHFTSPIYTRVKIKI